MFFGSRKPRGVVDMHGVGTPWNKRLAQINTGRH
nr:MAG TPA: hypothetical protein [Caudoviricetes sp.]